MQLRWCLVFVLVFCQMMRTSWAVDAEVLRQMVAADPEDHRARIMLAQHELRTGEYHQAREQISAVLVRDSAHVKARQIQVQLDALESSPAVLRNVELGNPFDPVAVDQALKTLKAANQQQKLFTLLSWLQSYHFPLTANSRYTLAKMLIERNNLQSAEQIFQGVQSTDHHRPLVRLKAEFCMQQHQWTCAADIYRRLWQQASDASDGLVLLKILQKQQQTGEANELMQSLLEHWPNHPEIADLSIQLGTDQDNVRHHDPALAYQRHPSDGNLRTLVRTRYRNGHRAAAVTLLDNHLATYPVDDTTRYMAAEIYAWEGRFVDTHRLLSEIEPVTDKVKLLDARAYAWAGELGRAKPLLQALTGEAKPAAIRLPAQMMLGFAHHWGGDTQAAARAFEPLLVEEHPSLDKAAMEEVVLLAKGNYAALIESTRERQIKTPDDPLLYLQLAEYQELAGDTAALKSFERYLQHKPDDILIRRRLGELYIRQNAYARGFFHLDRYAYQAHSADSLYLLAQNYYWVQRFGDAERVLGQLLMQFPTEPRALALMQQMESARPKSAGAGRGEFGLPSDLAVLEEANRLYQDEKYAAASRGFATYLARNPDDVDAHYRYASALEISGDHTHAASEFYIVSRSALNSDLVQYHYAYNLSRSGNYHAARRVFKALQLKLEKDRGLSDTPLPEMVESFIHSWQSSWQTKAFKRYQAHYVSEITNDAGWVVHKSGLFKRNRKIEVILGTPTLLGQSETGDSVRYRVFFTQDYRSDRLQDRGYKQLQLRCDPDKSCLIEKEQWWPIGTENGAVRRARALELLQLIRPELQRLEVGALEQGPGDKVVNSIYFGEGVGKLYRPEDEVLTREYVTAVSLDNKDIGVLLDDQATFRESSRVGQQQHIALNYSVFRDSDDVDFRMPSVHLSTPWQELELNLAVGRFEFSSPNCSSEHGYQLDLSAAYERWTVGGQLSQLRDHLNLMPYLRYMRESEGVFSTYALSYRPLFYEKLSCGSLERELTKLSAEFQQFRVLSDERSLWYSAALSHISDDNAELIGQLDYVFHTNNYRNFRYETAFNGWYIWNTDTSEDYYSPSFYDSNRFRLESHLPLNDRQQSAELQAVASVGYTFEESRALYDYGLWLNYPLSAQNIQARLGCRRSNSGRAAQARSAYRSTDCGMHVEYQW